MASGFLKKGKISFWGALVIIYVLLAPLEAFLIGPAGSILKYYAIGCIVLFVFKIILRTKIRIYSLAQASLLGFLLIVFFSALMSPYFARGMDVAQSIGLQVLFILTATQIDYNENEVKGFLFAYAVGCLILSSSVFANIEQVSQAGVRASASTSHGAIDPNNVAAYLVSAIAVLQRFKLNNILLDKGKYVVEVILVIAALMTASRGAAVALLIIVVYYVLTQGTIEDSIKKVVLILLMFIVVFCLCFYIFGSNNPISILIKRFVSDTTGGSSRISLWYNSIIAIGKKPFLGYGMGSSPYIINLGNLGSHNTFLTTWEIWDRIIHFLLYGLKQV